MIEKLVPKTIIRAIHNHTIPLYGSGKNIRDWIYVQDHCSAIDVVLQKGVSGEIYNISTGNEIQNIELVKKILVQLGKSENLITLIEDRPGHDTRYSLNSTSIQTNLGWKPKYNFEKTLKTTIQWYIDNPQWWAHLTTSALRHHTSWEL